MESSIIKVQVYKVEEVVGYLFEMEFLVYLVVGVLVIKFEIIKLMDFFYVKFYIVDVNWLEFFDGLDLEL